MAEHVEVVVKIPKYYLTHPQDYSCLAECVRRGTLLPQRHGRLIDADNMKRIDAIQRGDFNSIESIRKWIDVMPTVIEADKEE